MKSQYVLFILLLNWCFKANGQTTYDTLQHDGVERTYITYVPASYDGSSAVPLLLNFHGRNLTAESQMSRGDFRGIADREGFIIVHPQGLRDHEGRLSWNLNNNPNDTMDDLGFVSKILTEVGSKYNIDDQRIYSTGFSRGAFFSFVLSCNLGDQIAAIGGVAGSITDSTGCGKYYPKPVIQIHGTDDPTVGYEQYQIGAVMALFAAYNKCNLTAKETNLPDSDPNDGSTVTRIEYSGCANGITTVHLRVNGGGHSWPGSGNNWNGVNYDIDASEEVWNYVSQYNLSGRIQNASVNVQKPVAVKVYPQPAEREVKVILSDNSEYGYTLTTMTGETVGAGLIKDQKTLNLEGLKSGIYVLTIDGHPHKIVLNGL